MKHIYFVLTLGVTFFTTFFFLSSCKKINEATELGDDLIPAVDNVTTFDTTLTVDAYNDLFTLLTDSARITGTNRSFLGTIGNDPLFGTTEARIFVQLKPTFYPFFFPLKVDSLIGLDSVVLVLNYRETYGDSNMSQTVQVYEIDQASNFKFDSAYLIRKNDITSSNPLSGPVTFIPNTLDDSLVMFNEKAANQLRIKLNSSFGTRLLGYDTSAIGAYRSDSLFNTYFKGFEIRPLGVANALLGINLADSNTKLAIYFRYQKNGKPDTIVNYFRFSSLSASHNYVERNYSGSELQSYLGGATPDNLVYIQNTPGSFATLKIPALKGLSNRIVHRAELTIEQVYDPSDVMFPAPEVLYLDAFDSAKNKFRTIPFDVTMVDFNNIIINEQAFGIFGKKTADVPGNPIQIWKFNLSRYVQHVVNKTEPLYDLRLSSPFVIRDLFRIGNTDTDLIFRFNATIAKGRVRVGGGNHPTQRMRLRIIYSKI